MYFHGRVLIQHAQTSWIQSLALKTEIKLKEYE